MRLTFYLLFLFFPFLGYCQIQNTDSLKKVIVNEKKDNKKSILYSKLSKQFQEIEIDSAIHYAQLGYKLSRRNDYTIGVAENASSLGYCYVLKNDLNSSKEFYTKARQNFSDTDSIFKYTQSSMRLGNINLAQNNPIEALMLYQECLEYSKSNDFKQLFPHLYNNIGLVYMQTEDYTDALSNFETAYKLFIANEDEANSVYSLYNISLIKSILGDDEEAVSGYLDLVSYHLKTENWLSLAQIYNSISEIHLKDKAYDQAMEYLEMALNLIEDKNDSFNTGPTSYHKASIYANASELYYFQKNFGLAKSFAYKTIALSDQNDYKLKVMQATRILADVYDVTKQPDSSLYYYKQYIDYNTQYQNENDVKKLTSLKLQNEFDEILRQNEIERIQKENEYKNRELRYIALMVFGGLIAIILVLLFLNIRSKNAKLRLKEENLVLEKNQLNQDLDYKKKELVSNLIYLLEKNEFITSISKKLMDLKPEAKKDNKEIIQQIINEIKHNSSKKMWEEFELRFKEVHTEFYQKLLESHPDLTPNEVKLSAFLRLNMTTKEISAITYQSVKSINVARFRLRKKLQMERDENLIAYLSSL